MNVDEVGAKDVSNAAKKVAQKVGAGAKVIGQKIGAKASGSMMSKAMDKVSKGEALPANLAKQIAPFAKQLETILADTTLRQKFMTIIKQAEQAQKQAQQAQQADAAGTAAKAVGGAIAKGAKAVGGAVKSAAAGVQKATTSAAQGQAPTNTKAAPTTNKNVAVGDTYEKAKGDVRKVQGGEKPMPPNAAADIQTAIAKLAKGDKESGVFAAQKIMNLAKAGVDVSKQQQAWVANSKAAERFLTQSVYFAITKMLREHNLSWSDLGMRVHLLEGTNKLIGISLI
jgi:hypothetical protein